MRLKVCCSLIFNFVFKTIWSLSNLPSVKIWTDRKWYIFIINAKAKAKAHNYV